MSNPNIFVAIIVFGVLLDAGTSAAQDGPPGPAAAPEKRVRELEREVSALRDEVARLRKEVDAAKVQVVLLTDADPDQAAKFAQALFHDTPGLTVEALPRLRGVAVRADAPTTREVGEALGRLDKMAASCRTPFDRGPVHIPEEALIGELLHAVKVGQKSPEKK
jgi:hypothetical protein